MKLAEIIQIHLEQPSTSIELEYLRKYKRSLDIYFRNHYNCFELILMVTTVFNAAQYGRIVPDQEFEESMREYLGDLSEEDIQTEMELINIQSILFKDL